MNYILYSGTTSETGARLRDMLGIRGGINPPGDRADVLIRWGNSDNVRYRPQRVINSREGVALAANKLESLLKLRRDGLPVPRMWSNPQDVDRFPVLGRRTRHTQGRDIILCLNPRDLGVALELGVTHFTEYMPKVREFRMHVFGDEIIKTSEKVLTNAEEYNAIIWNYEYGFTFRNPADIPLTLLNEMERAAKLCVQSLGLMFGAADVIIDFRMRPWVLEVNTGPSLADNSLDVYAGKLRELLGLETPGNDDRGGDSPDPEPDQGDGIGGEDVLQRDAIQHGVRQDAPGGGEE